jgi:diguanylate cyclase (GGDEF)-like protein
MIDIDHFKPYNDHHGHVEGDRCIRTVAQTLARVIHRSTDLVARYGGEEFAAILPDTDQDAAAWLAEACRKALADLALPHHASSSGPCVSISIGLCSMTVDTDLPAETLVTRADQALYEAKRGGRNRVRVWG